MSEDFRKDDQQVYHALPLERLSWLEHGFGTRHSDGAFAGRNTVTLRQVHSAVAVHARGGSRCAGTGDGLYTGEPGLMLVVRTADCLPLLLADERRRAVAAIHAGWRGAVRGVVAETLRAMAGSFGSQQGDIHAAIGPGIGHCCFETGPEVAALFQPFFPERMDLGARARIDLEECVTRQLFAAGVGRQRIYRASLCTSCRIEDFHSWRRDRDPRSRMYSVICIRPQENARGAGGSLRL